MPIGLSSTAGASQRATLDGESGRWLVGGAHPTDRRLTARFSGSQTSAIARRFWPRNVVCSPAMSSLPEHRQLQLAVLRKAFAGIAAGDADAMLANYTDDMVLELPYSSPPLRFEGKEKVRRFLQGAFKVFRFTLEIGDDVYDLVDPDTLVLEYTGQGSVLTTGKPYNNSYISVYRFRGDKICHVREYVNPTVANEALAL